MAPSIERDDDDVLDGVFEQALGAWNEGRAYSIEDAIGGRRHLRTAAGEAVRLARLVAVQGSGAVPPVAGFEILGELGRGSSGTVFLARSLDLGRVVALKVLAPALSLDGTGSARLLAEARALARIEHPNVVRIYEVVEDGIPAYAMEWVDGGSAADLLRPEGDAASAAGPPAGPWALRVPAGLAAAGDWRAFACRIGIAVGRALGAVHRAGLVHRDVKPSNILIRSNGSALLSDFGIVRDPDLSAFTRSGDLVGTPAYAAPEQIRGDSTAIGPASDVFGLGATLFHLLTGRQPFGAGPDGASRQRSPGDELPLPRTIDRAIPRDLESILLHATEIDPTRRYPTADTFADDLEALLGLRPVKARPPSWIGRSLKAARRHRGVVLGVVLAAACASASVFGLWRATEARREARIAAVGELRRARTMLLDSRFRGRIWEWLGGSASGYRMPSEREESLGPVIAAYLGAQDLDPENASITQELRALECARDALQERPDDKLLDGLPARFIGDFRAHTRSVTQADVASAGSAERRLAGFVAFALQDLDACLGAWEGSDLEPGGDAFVDAALGRLSIELNEPDRAYPRLVRGSDAFPEAGFLALDVADAAVQCGDADVAERYLSEATRRRDPDVFRVRDRVQGLLILEARLDLDGAVQRLDRAYVESGSSTTRMLQARLLERRGKEGDLNRALRRHAEVAHLTGGLPRFSDGVSRLAPTWWTSLRPEDRLDAVVAAVTGRRGDVGHLRTAETVTPPAVPALPPSLYLICFRAEARAPGPLTALLSRTAQRILDEQRAALEEDEARIAFRRFLHTIPVTEALVLSEAGLARALDVEEARVCAVRAAEWDPVVAGVQPPPLRRCVARLVAFHLITRAALAARPWLRGTALRGPFLLDWLSGLAPRRSGVPSAAEARDVSRDVASRALAFVLAVALGGTLDPTEIGAPELDVEVVAKIPDPWSLAVGADGSIVVAGVPDQGVGRLWRIGAGGIPAPYLEREFPDPSGIVFDDHGAFTGIPGGLVGRSSRHDPSCELAAIRPDGSVATIPYRPTIRLNAPEHLANDGRGRLIIASRDDDQGLSATVFACREGTMELLSLHPRVVSSLAIGPQDRITIADRSGHVFHFDANGTPIDSSLPGFGGWPQIAYGRGGPFWGNDFYVFSDALGLLLRVQDSVQITVVGSGFGTSRCTGMAFGPDQSLYLGRLRDGGEVLRIRPAGR